MSKPKSMEVPGQNPKPNQRHKAENSGNQEPLSGSKKVKNQNHVDHHNREGG
ncbi:small acid-soluble spore protein P (minor) [Paenibacillus shirakamiensis]|uniref:Small acid-soluble spore protein P (Minor) n=1 Tax=Paenibacillus shirakamiensis TaxID=1265935 RepID=A0ABS4JNR8_9BACL|nr:small acid-soluble spore protein P [Paenibacillus shirakamiensis]MBP2002780.1 small acid-soluble spore protein P (minor) [Paenibacillus shirakamiensis]